MTLVTMKAPAMPAEPAPDPAAPPDPAPHVPVDPKLLDILVCPLTKMGLIYDRAAGELISQAAGLAYPIRDGIPIMLPEEARKLD
jgi:uncharacterized protein YbaR (Trm112 family)